jgi:hypothetical protein
MRDLSPGPLYSKGQIHKKEQFEMQSNTQGRWLLSKNRVNLAGNFFGAM